MCKDCLPRNLRDELMPLPNLLLHRTCECRRRMDALERPPRGAGEGDDVYG
jgi:hypothetical protein